MVILAHLKRQGGAKTHHTHDLSTHEKIISTLKKIWFMCHLYVRNRRNCYVTDMAI